LTIVSFDVAVAVVIIWIHFHTDRLGICPSCGTKATFYDNPERTKGLWQMVKCRSCTKKWEVSWDEEEHLDFGRKMFTAKCTECDYQTKIKNPKQFLNYRALHQQQSGHTGMMPSGGLNI